jgi:Flp pilus assembly protein TadB
MDEHMTTDPTNEQTAETNSDWLEKFSYAFSDRLFTGNSNFEKRIEKKLNEAQMTDNVEMFLSRALAVGVITGFGLWMFGMIAGYLLLEIVGWTVLLPLPEPVAPITRTLRAPLIIFFSGLLFGSIGFGNGFFLIISIPYIRAFRSDNSKEETKPRSSQSEDETEGGSRTGQRQTGVGVSDVAADISDQEKELERSLRRLKRFLVPIVFIIGFVFPMLLSYLLYISVLSSNNNFIFVLYLTTYLLAPIFCFLMLLGVLFLTPSQRIQTKLSQIEKVSHYANLSETERMEQYFRQPGKFLREHTELMWFLSGGLGLLIFLIILSAIGLPLSRDAIVANPVAGTVAWLIPIYTIFLIMAVFNVWKRRHIGQVNEDLITVLTEHKNELTNTETAIEVLEQAANTESGVVASELRHLKDSLTKTGQLAPAMTDIATRYPTRPLQWMAVTVDEADDQWRGLRIGVDHAHRGQSFERHWKQNRLALLAVPGLNFLLGVGILILTLFALPGWAARDLAVTEGSASGLNPDLVVMLSHHLSVFLALSFALVVGYLISLRLIDGLKPTLLLGLFVHICHILVEKPTSAPVEREATVSFKMGSHTEMATVAAQGATSPVLSYFQSPVFLFAAVGGLATVLGSYRLLSRTIDPALPDVEDTHLSVESVPAAVSSSQTPVGQTTETETSASSKLDNYFEQIDTHLTTVQRARNDGRFEDARQACRQAVDTAQTARNIAERDAPERVSEVESRLDSVIQLRDTVSVEGEAHETLTTGLDKVSSELDTVDTGTPYSALSTLAEIEEALDDAKAKARQFEFPGIDQRINRIEDRLDGLRQQAHEMIQARRQPPERIPKAPQQSLAYSEIQKDDPVGSGGNADVYRAITETENGELELALKEPRMSGTLHTETVERMLKEADTWQQLDDNNYIVSVVDYGSEPLPWIAMEYMDAGHLGERANKMDFGQKLWTAIVTTRAVRHAHRHGVVHLDLKPENILLRSAEDVWEVPKVADWGLSKHLLEHSKSIEGLSPHYAAPEQFDEEFGSTDDITDVYQLGAVFYELFTGRPPFEGQATKVMRAVLDDEPNPPSEYANLPDQIDEILLTALATDKQDRYEHVLYLRDDLQDLWDNY